MRLIREAWSIYWGHKKLIALVALFILMPLAVLNFFISFSFQYYFTLLFLPIGGDFMQSLFSLVFLSMMEIPFIVLVFLVIHNEEVTFGRGFGPVNIFPLWLWIWLLVLPTHWRELL